MQYLIIYLVISFLLVFGTNSAEGLILKAHNMKDIEKIVLERTTKLPAKDMLCVWDVDMVITQPANPESQLPNLVKFKSVWQEILADLSPLEKAIALNLSTKSLPNILVDQTASTIITNILAQQIKSIALTDSFTGRLDNIDAVEEWRYNELRNLGIDFTNSFPELTKIIFNDLPAFRNSSPMFFNGILLTNSNMSGSSTKPKLLESFLGKVNFNPKLIIFIDDRQQNLHTMEEHFINSDVEILSIHFTKALSAPSENINEKRFVDYWQKVTVHAKHLAESLN